MREGEEEKENDNSKLYWKITTISIQLSIYILYIVTYIHYTNAELYQKQQLLFHSESTQIYMYLDHFASK